MLSLIIYLFVFLEAKLLWLQNESEVTLKKIRTFVFDY